MSNSDPDSRVGTRFGPYQLLDLLGRGGMGEVYRAEDTRKHRVVALKLVSPQLSGNPSFRARIQREADSAGRLTEPHVVPIHDYGEIDGQFYVEMRLIEGEDLSALLKRQGPMSPPRAVAIIGQIAAALDAAHAVGITHRDVKPENILVTRDDFAYLVDFGIAVAASDPGLTETGTAVGTYNYMAPERFSSDEVTYRADIYSLACVLGECLTGAPPYRSESIQRLIAAHLMEPPPRPSMMRPGQVPLALDQVIARGMAKNPRDRYSSAGDLAHAAHDALTTADQQQAMMIMRNDQNSGPATAMAPGYHHQTGGYQQSGGYHHSGGYQQSTGYPQASGVQAQPANLDETMAGPVATGWRDAPRASHPSAAPSAAAVAAPAFEAAPKERDNRKLLLIGAVAVAVAAVIGLVALLVGRPHDGATTADSNQRVVPFNGLDFRLSPGGVALDHDDNLYITNQGMYGHVVKLPKGSNAPEVLAFTGLYEPQGVAVDDAGAVYVTDFNNRVVKFDPADGSQTELPITGLNYPEGIAVDQHGAVYVADRGNNRIVKLDKGSDAQTVLPFNGLHNPDDVAVDKAGNVYVTDTDNDRVVKLAATGSSGPIELPFTDLSSPWGVAVDDAGNVYVTNHENHKVVKYVASSETETLLPFTGLNTPLQLGVGKDGTVYVADRGNNRVVELAK